MPLLSLLLEQEKELEVTTPKLYDFILKQQQEQENKKLTKYSNRLRIMDFVVLRSIVGRARHELVEFNNGYSRSDKLRYRRLARYQSLSTISITDQSRINCDKCNNPIEFNELFFIQKRKSYNKYYHHQCASSLNMCF